MGPNGSNACTVCVLFGWFSKTSWTLKRLVSNRRDHLAVANLSLSTNTSSQYFLGVSANVTFSLCDLEEVIDMGAETYPQACERWGQAACKDFVCLFGSWTS